LLRRAAFAATCLALLAPAAAEATKPVTVMTRNLYLGGDITRPLAATAGLSGLQALVAFGGANAQLRGIVDATNFPARAQLIAAEVAQRDPDLIGLQEVALWRHGPLDLAHIGTADSTVVDYDFLQILRDALAARGLHYSVVGTPQTESDVEGPAFSSFPPGADARDVRLTMRDAILKRDSSDIKIENSGSGQYATRLTFAIAGVPFAFIRGFNWADVRAGSERFRFVNTHLESQASVIANAQAQELLAGAASAPGRPVVIVCDCNSDPLNGTSKPGDIPHWSAYRTITGAGFSDEWLQFAPAAAGFTSGLSELVNDPDLSSINHRIDMVFGHGARGGPLPVDKAWIVGRDARTPGGLWASDHMGVVVRLRPGG
jgi:endonuclease/exonuclease/phosphatase family metal-dependent hydrolase